MIDIRHIPSMLVRQSFTVARLPLMLLSTRPTPDGELVENKRYPLVDNIEASVKTLAGSLLRDDDLKQEGQELRRRVELLRAAESKEATAKQLKAAADEQMNARLNENKARRQRVEQRTEKLERTAEQEAAEEKARIKRAEQAAREAAAQAEAEERTKLQVEETVKELAAVGAHQRAEQLQAEELEAERAAHKATEKLKNK